MSPQPKPITDYVPVIDTLHLNLTKDLNPDNSFILTTHSDINLLTVNHFNALDKYRSDGFVLERKYIRNQNFHLVYDVSANNTHFATLYLDRKSGFENQKNLIPFHLTNATLYTEWIGTLTNFLAAFELTISTFSQIHIALDTNQNPIKNYYRLLNHTAFIKIHDKKLDAKVKTNGTYAAGGKREDSLSIGSTHSAKQTVIYNKTKELADKASKPYIKAHHEANGLAGSDVFRIELKLTNDAVKDYRSMYVNDDGEALTNYQKKRQHLADIPDSTYQPITAFKSTELDYTRFTSPSYLASLFEKFVNIDFRYNNDKRPSRCTKFNFIDFTKYQKETIMTKIQYKDSQSNNFRIEKQTLEAQIKVFKDTLNPLFLESAAAYASEFRLQSHLSKLIRLYNIESVVTAQLPTGYFDDVIIENRILALSL